MRDEAAGVLPGLERAGGCRAERDVRRRVTAKGDAANGVKAGSREIYE
jgi:hypothetical protein